MAKSIQEYFEREVKRNVAEARAIAASAETESRELTSEETAKVEGHLKAANDYKGQIAAEQRAADLKDAIDHVEGELGVTPTVEAPRAKTIGQAFVRSDAYKALRSRGLKGRWSTGMVDFGMKAVADLDDGSDNDVVSITGAGGTLPLQPQVLPILGPVEQKLTVADLFGQGVATQNSIVYLKETITVPGALDNPYTPANAGTADAVLTPEGQVKPAAYVDFEKQTAALDKIAAFMPISDEMLEDEPQIASYITGRLPIFIGQAEEAYLLDKLTPGAGSSAGDIDGDGMFDGIAAAILAVKVNGGLDADAVLINPADFWRMAVTKAIAGTGGYFSGGPYAGPSQNPWGVTAVVTSAAPVGGPIVGAFKAGATVFRKGGLSVEASNSHSDYFVRNLTALRAEERLALVVLRPEAFQTASSAS